VERRQGSGVYVRTHSPRGIEDARGLDEMIRVALDTAYRRGFSGDEVRAAVMRWLAASPVERVLVVDVEREMAELLVEELGTELKVPVQGMTFEELSLRPAASAGALIAAHRYHVGRIGRLIPGALIEALNIHAPEVREQVERLNPGALIVVVSHSPALLPIASVLLQSMRGDEIVVEARLLGATKEWKSLLRAADFVLADVLSYPAVRPAAPRRVHEFRLVAPESIARVRAGLATVAPEIPKR
jgi:GntR family transcriptional regulator